MSPTNEPDNQNKGEVSWADDPAAGVNRLFEDAYPELCRVAERWVRQGGPITVLQPTLLVHEAFLKLAGSSGLEVRSRTHFFSLAARAMRQILVDHARRRSAAKRGGGGSEGRLTLSGIGGDAREAVDVLALDEALQTLAGLNPRHARVVEMRFFAGMDAEQTAAALGVSRRTAELDWAAARAWLFAQLNPDADA